MPEQGYPEKLQNETTERETLITEKNEALREQLAVYREPLEQQTTQINEVINGHNETLKTISAEEKNLQNTIKTTDKDIAAAGKLKLLGDVGKELVEKLTAQKTEAQAHLAAFAERKKEILERLTGMKANKTEIDAELKRINNIGKTPEELRAEKREKKTKEKAAAQQTKATADVASSGATAKTQGNIGATTAETGATEDVEETEESVPATETSMAIKAPAQKKTAENPTATVATQENNLISLEENQQKQESELRLKMTVEGWVQHFAHNEGQRSELRSHFHTQDNKLMAPETILSETEATPRIIKFFTENIPMYKNQRERARQSVLNELARFKEGQRNQQTAA